jgi:hypothetical protein
MSTLYEVKVLKVDRVNSFADFNIKVVHADAMSIYETAGFALHILHNEKWTGSPLSTEISSEDLYDDSWSTQYAKGFVTEFEIIDTIFEQPESSKYKYDPEYAHPFWDKPDEWPEAVLRITCSDSAWLEHIYEGDQWDSTAFNPARYYDDCEPIIYDKGNAISKANSNEEDGWIPFPSFLVSHGTVHLPKVLSFPAYTESAYEYDKISDIR